MRLTNGSPLGSSLLLPVDTVNCVAKLKVPLAVMLESAVAYVVANLLLEVDLARGVSEKQSTRAPPPASLLGGCQPSRVVDFDSPLRHVVPSQHRYKIAIACSGVWWLAFSAYSFKGLRNPAGETLPESAEACCSCWAYFALSWKSAYQTLKEIKKFPKTFKFILLWFFYSDGVRCAFWRRRTIALEDAIGIHNVARVVKPGHE
jgi:hypothetical protein